MSSAGRPAATDGEGTQAAWSNRKIYHVPATSRSIPLLQAGGSNALHDADTYSTHDACDGEMAVSGGVFLQRMHVCGSTFVLVPLPSGEANAIVKREHVDGQI